MEERISDIQDRNLEINQKEEERNQRIKNNEREIQELSDTIRRKKHKNNGNSQKGGKAAGIRKQMIDKNFPNIRNELELGIQEVNRTQNYLNSKKPSLRHIVLTLFKINDKDRILRASREKKTVTYNGKPIRLYQTSQHKP
uniref:L1 transposable element RRM domain-containing protein n=1 Tax=Rousettus aegyptiacus TaxID=9407 RepID=A0A7J8GA72_ROUAE|nr:hypothetical protein HJG63_011598 [Rousettus aegyptiacus]